MNKSAASGVSCGSSHNGGPGAYALTVSGQPLNQPNSDIFAGMTPPGTL